MEEELTFSVLSILRQAFQAGAKWKIIEDDLKFLNSDSCQLDYIY